ncbi:MFS transporter [Sorangium sp. So ce1153]|uniref:MFS transporter n=1 Tax=Sorangium sp. So ce1153 TaxID=3133333 RepID=UPI003F5EADDA
MNGIKQLLANRIFRIFWAGEAISVLGDQFYLLALPWMTLELTGSPSALGNVLMAAAIPRAALMPVGGVVVDRWSPQTVLLVSNVARAVIVAVLTALVITDQTEIWHLFVLGVAFGSADALAFPAYMSITPRLVAEEHLPAANAAVQGTSAFAGIIGPAVAGVVVSAVGIAGAFAIDTLSFVVVVTTLFWMSRLLRSHSASQAAPGAAQPAKPPMATRDVARAVVADPVLRTVLVIVAAINLGVLGPIAVGLPALVRGGLGAGSTMLGAVMGTFAAGSLAGMLAAALLPRPGRPGPVTRWTTGGLAAGMALLGVATMFPQLLALVFVTVFSAGVALGYLNVQGLSWLQARVPEAMLGRVMSILVLSANGLGPVSYAASGFAAEHTLSGLFLGGGAIVGLAWIFSRSPAFNNATT